MKNAQEKAKFNFEFDENTPLDEKIRIIVNKQIIEPYSEKAVEEAKEYIYYSDANERLMPIEMDMCMRILSTWKLDLYDIEIDEVVESIILSPTDKFMHKLLHTKILRLLPGGITILSIGISQELAKRLTSAIGYAVSELTCSYVNLLRQGKKIDPKDAYNRDALVDLIDDYIVEFNKTIVK